MLQKQMVKTIAPAGYGILIGLTGLLFGIGWAFWLVLGHERIHESLERRAVERQGQGLIMFFEPATAQAHTKDKPVTEEATHMHQHEGTVPDLGTPHLNPPLTKGGAEGGVKHFEGGHDSPVMELSHTRLRRGHIHLMGLGTLTIVLSMVITFTGAPIRIKTVIPILIGLGGIIYPLAWIIMGYRTPALGPDGADASVRFIAGPGIVLVTLGILATMVFLIRDIFSEEGI